MCEFDKWIPSPFNAFLVRAIIIVGWSVFYFFDLAQQRSNDNGSWRFNLMMNVIPAFPLNAPAFQQQLQSTKVSPAPGHDSIHGYWLQFLTIFKCDSEKGIYLADQERTPSHLLEKLISLMQNGRYKGLFAN